MVDLRSPRPRVLVRAAPRPPILGAAALASCLLALAVCARHTALVVPLTYLGMAACGGGAGYVLDEGAAEIADATPTSRPHRLGWRLTVALVPWGIGLAGLALVDRGPWQSTVTVTLGCVGLGVVATAALRRSGRPAPGDQAGVLALGVILLLVTADPLRRWVSLVPFDVPHAGRTATAWVLMAGACLTAVAVCERDPCRRPRSPIVGLTSFLRKEAP